MPNINLFKTPRTLSVLLATVISILAGFAFYLLKSSNENLFLTTLAFTLFVFTASFLSSLLFINLFVIKRIKPLFKALYVSEKDYDLIDELDHNHLLEKLENDIKVWAESKTEEIDRLKQMERYRKEFLGNVSHELKTPIFNIQGYVLTLLDGGLEDPTVNRKYLERTEKSINRLIGIVEDLELISKLEAGELQLNLERFNIVELVKETFDSLEERAKKRSIALRIKDVPDKLQWVYADKKRIQQVLYNLIINSINYGIDGGVTAVSISDIGNRIQVDVNDNGIGIPSKDVPRIFERFYRVDKSRSREQGGTGLGLAIVKHIIEGHKQIITVKSTPKKGTTFSFTLNKPVAKF
ncbi:sensor histidine kinase [Tenuifilum thalassicum]|uniref:histidine kinase n=1 Tax=Tenuifilum thalassicum TaxID=2590900 RepID=A0A7D3Y2P9_9BACT|nr:ATP-binding protein [Tenuifilum thalassicum]QKG78949.1 sensor histidine kinase [Tenuifilum thalassicum]